MVAPLVGGPRAWSHGLQAHCFHDNAVARRARHVAICFSVSQTLRDMLGQSCRTCVITPSAAADHGAIAVTKSEWTAINEVSCRACAAGYTMNQVLTPQNKSVLLDQDHVKRTNQIVLLYIYIYIYIYINIYVCICVYLFFMCIYIYIHTVEAHTT